MLAGKVVVDAPTLDTSGRFAPGHHPGGSQRWFDFHAARAQTAQVYELFYSESTGYFSFWNPNIWTVQDQSTAKNSDWIRLYDDHYDVFGEIYAFLAPGVSTTDCLSTMLDQLAAAPSTMAIEALSEEDGPPHIGDSSSDLIQARSSDVVLTTSDGDAPAKLAARLECREIVPGQSMLAKLVQVPAQVYNENDLWPFWLELDLDLFEELTRDDLTLPMPDPSGQVVGTIAAVHTCFASNLFGLARGLSSGEEFIVDPAAFIAIGDDGNSLPITLVWSLPEVASDAPLSLDTGEFALFQIVNDGPDRYIGDLSYAPLGASPILLSHFEGGCGAGGGAPVLIDVD